MIQTMTAVQRALDQAYDARGVGRAVRDRVWMGGVRPIGYDVRDRRLGINPAEAETVRQIFGRYLGNSNQRWHQLQKLFDVGIHNPKKA
jgi:hypothetical protein